MCELLELLHVLAADHVFRPTLLDAVQLLPYPVQRAKLPIVACGMLTNAETPSMGMFVYRVLSEDKIYQSLSGQWIVGVNGIHANLDRMASSFRESGCSRLEDDGG